MAAIAAGSVPLEAKAENLNPVRTIPFMPQISVILCAHNPRPDFLQRTLNALRQQTLPASEWELLLVDNASKEPLATRFDLSWHPAARHVREEELGLTAARLRGIKESTGSLLVFVDDDNLLAADYLAAAQQITRTLPVMKVFGGNVTGEFETAPETWMQPYLPLLALRELKRDHWSNDPMRLGFYPCGAGICVDRAVAEVYFEKLKQDPRRKQLGRRGAELTSGEDDDICFTAGSLGHGVGVFTTLSLTHLIPSGRLTEAYLLRLVEGVTYSGYVLACLWQRDVRPPVHSWRWRIGVWRQQQKMSEREKRFAEAKIRAEQRAWETIRVMEKSA